MHGSFAKIEISTPCLDNTPGPATTIIAESLRIQNSENSGGVTTKQVLDAYRYVHLYAKEPIIVMGAGRLQFYTLKSPYIITDITTTDVTPRCKKALENNGFPEPISVQELENGTYGPVKGRPKKFKRTCVSADVQKTTMVARGYWNDKEKKAEDLPLLIHKKTIFERITEITVKHEHKYFSQSPDDKQSFLIAKRSTFNHEVYILEPE
ncbi:MAG: hypothetical protein QS748_09480 [Candidatus Endonucleobacter bathymodioli]|uniref:Uncharacterized protein n=1 Tax=Candidatus Endonucleibacter bathymodioli TaxID=539814 RepID=A0AA90STC6_9GAMM|nr:hypothetical protein [Candidatus Endonucleobacter bathymodioli]